MRNQQPISNRCEPARGSSLHTIKTQQKAREEEEKARQRRKKGVIVMVLQFLQEQGYMHALEALQRESGVNIAKVTPADNVDLLQIFSEFEDYHEFRFGKLPRFFRHLDGSDVAQHQDVLGADGEAMLRRNGPVASTSTTTPVDPTPLPPSAVASNAGRGATEIRKRALPNSGSDGKGVPHEGVTDDLGVSGKAIKMRCDDSSDEIDSIGFVGRQLKPMPRFGSAELQELAAAIQRDILEINPNVLWSHIAELDHAKLLLKEAVVMPVKYPELFRGLIRPWKGILLFGPPGTGKTMLARALATECRTTFFNISASSIVSKWRGDSEKLVRMLFDLAVHYSPSTIFIDELDSLMSARSSDGSEHEGSRRMKTELLVQMDGLAKRQDGDGVFVLAASNIPWDLDGAILRRLEKRILVGLPSLTARKALFMKLLPSVEENFDVDVCARLTEGHSGADIDIVCREAMMRPIRQYIEKLETEKVLSNAPLKRPKVSTADVVASIACTRSSGQSIPLKKYEEWERNFGSGMSQ